MTIVNGKSFHSTIEDKNLLHLNLLEKYPNFSVENILLKYDSINNSLHLIFIYRIANLDYFTHKLKIKIDKEKFNNFFKQDNKYIQEFKKLILSTSIIEAINYWKLTTSPNFYFYGDLNSEELEFYKKVYFKGLSEFFYRNRIEHSYDTFLNFKSKADLEINKNKQIEIGELINDGFLDLNKFIDKSIKEALNRTKCNDTKTTRKVENFIDDSIMIPVGGGKDSAVSLEILKSYPSDIYSFRINNNQAAIDCENVANIPLNNRLNIIRNIDKKLLDYNKQNFLNGHVPFSAILAHLAFIVAKLFGIKYITLSNESSANSSYVEGLDVNHQWSKSLEFELLFREHANKYFDSNIVYLSILRPFSELSIAKKFAQLDTYWPIFRSCNLGSKNNANVWCCDCAKCLFVFIILSAFINFDNLINIFSSNLLENRGLEDDFDRLCGKISTRPFECVGESSEVRYALCQFYNKFKNSNYDLPYLLKHFVTDVKNNIYNDLSFIEDKMLYNSVLPLGSLKLSTIPNELKIFVRKMAEDIDISLEI